MKKVIPIGLLAGLLILIVGMLISQLFQLAAPELKSEYENTELFRSMNDPIMSLFYIHPFVLGMFFSWVWNLTKRLFMQQHIWQRGSVFGVIYWLTTLPGMLISFSSFQVSLTMVVSWSLAALVEGVLAGILCAKMIR